MREFAIQLHTQPTWYCAGVVALEVAKLPAWTQGTVYTVQVGTQSVPVLALNSEA